MWVQRWIGNIDVQMVGGTLYGLSAALYGEVTFYDGEVEQTNFPDYDAIRMANCPELEVKNLKITHTLRRR